MGNFIWTIGQATTALHLPDNMAIIMFGGSCYVDSQVVFSQQVERHKFHMGLVHPKRYRMLSSIIQDVWMFLSCIANVDDVDGHVWVKKIMWCASV